MENSDLILWYLFEKPKIDRREYANALFHLEDEGDKMHISWKMYVLAIPECARSSPKRMLSYPHHLKTSGVADGQRIVSQIQPLSLSLFLLAVLAHWEL